MCESTGADTQQEQVMETDADHLANIVKINDKQQVAIFRLAAKIQAERHLKHEAALKIARYKFDHQGKEPPGGQTSTK